MLWHAGPECGSKSRENPVLSTDFRSMLLWLGDQAMRIRTTKAARTVATSPPTASIRQFDAMKCARPGMLRGRGSGVCCTSLGYTAPRARLFPMRKEFMHCPKSQTSSLHRLRNEGMLSQ